MDSSHSPINPSLESNSIAGSPRASGVRGRSPTLVGESSRLGSNPYDGMPRLDRYDIYDGSSESGDDSEGIILCPATPPPSGLKVTGERVCESPGFDTPRSLKYWASEGFGEVRQGEEPVVGRMKLLQSVADFPVHVKGHGKKRGNSSDKGAPHPKKLMTMPTSTHEESEEFKKLRAELAALKAENYSLRSQLEQPESKTSNSSTASFSCSSNIGQLSTQTGERVGVKSHVRGLGLRFVSASGAGGHCLYHAVNVCRTSQGLDPISPEETRQKVAARIEGDPAEYFIADDKKEDFLRQVRGNDYSGLNEVKALAYELQCPIRAINIMPNRGEDTYGSELKGTPCVIVFSILTEGEIKGGHFDAALAIVEDLEEGNDSGEEDPDFALFSDEYDSDNSDVEYSNDAPPDKFIKGIPVHFPTKSSPPLTFYSTGSYYNVVPKNEENFSCSVIEFYKMERVRGSGMEYGWGVHFIKSGDPFQISPTSAYISSQRRVSKGIKEAVANGSKVESGCTLAFLFYLKWNINSIYRTKVRGHPSCIDDLKFFIRDKIDAIDTRRSWSCQLKFRKHDSDIVQTLLGQSNLPDDLKDFIRNGNSSTVFDPAEDSDDEEHILMNPERVVSSLPKPFKCNLCPKGFTKKESLTNHLLWHANYSETCPKCQKKFTNPRNLSEHLRRHERNESVDHNLTEEEVKIQRKTRLVLQHTPELITWIMDTFEIAEGMTIKIADAFSLYQQNWANKEQSSS